MTLHTHPAQIRKYATIGRDLLTALGNVIDHLEESNTEERELPAIGRIEAREELLAERIEEQLDTESVMQHLRDVIYLLAVGDNGAAATAAADPEERSRQRHHQLRTVKHHRLVEQGWIES